jgi:predicted CXXCH cytochrome family protein
MKTGRFLFMTMLVLLALLPGDSAWGKARGLCVSCHTMHNMQDGGAVDAGGPQQALLNNNCVGCHGNFHHQMNDAQPGDVSGAWIRHPSDVVIPDETEYAGYTTYNPLAPVAKTDLSGQKNSAVVVPGSDLVTCISCHRPHGSPNPDMLRWDYTTCRSEEANAACGCFVCHTAKDD